MITFGPARLLQRHCVLSEAVELFLGVTFELTNALKKCSYIKVKEITRNHILLLNQQITLMYLKKQQNCNKNYNCSLKLTVANSTMMQFIKVHKQTTSYHSTMEQPQEGYYNNVF